MEEYSYWYECQKCSSSWHENQYKEEEYKDGSECPHCHSENIKGHKSVHS